MAILGGINEFCVRGGEKDPESILGCEGKHQSQDRKDLRGDKENPTGKFHLQKP